GRLFHEFAVTIGAAILVSGVVSLTLTPMLCSRFLRPPSEAAHGAFYARSERVYERVLGWYEGSLNWVMQRRPAALGFSVAILIATVALFLAVPKGFLPSEDNSQIFGTTETVQGSSFDDLVQHQLQVMAVLQNPPPIQIGGRRTKSLYQFTLQSPDRTALYDNATRLTNQLRQMPDLVNVTSDLQISNPQASVTINRDRAAALGVTAQQVEEALYDAYGSAQVSTIYTATNQYWVVMELLPEYQQDLSALSLLYIRAQNGTLVPLASLATITSSVGPLTVSH